MRIRIPVIVKDPEVSDWKDISPTEEIEIQDDVFLDGPVSPRVAILDFQTETGKLLSGATFKPPLTLDGIGTYAIPKPVQPESRDIDRIATNVSTFGAVYKTLNMFEEPDALGRRIVWAFGAPQLLVVPRAGQWANAYYERESHSLQFFYFAAEGNGQVIHTAHSQDIVAHETAHAILDGVAPDLYDAITPEALAIHESVADLSALLCSFRCRELSRRILQVPNALNHSTAFSGIGEQYARGLDPSRHYLRDLANSKSLKKGAKQKDRVDRTEPHALSEVLSGALYHVMARVHAELTNQYAEKDHASTDVVEQGEAEFVQHRRDDAVPVQNHTGAALKALFVGGERFKRTLYRGLDYLPPGDVTFADLARAILAADEISHPDSSQQREWLKEEFVRRGVVGKASELRVRVNFEHKAVDRLDLEAIVKSDYAAYEFAGSQRRLLGIPEKASFEVRPRLDVTKLYWHRDGKKMVRECLLKVAWTELEENDLGKGFPRQRRYTSGATLAIDWETNRVRALLQTTRPPGARHDTTRLLKRLADDDLLRLDEDAIGPARRPLHGVISGQVIGGKLRVRGAGRMLHLVPGGWS